MKNNKALKRLVTVFLAAVFMFIPLSLSVSAALPAPDWVTTEMNPDYSKTVILKTPTYMLTQIDYYEYSTDGFLTYQTLSNPEGGEFIIDKTCDFSIRYFSNGISSPVYSVEIIVNKNTIVSCPSTGISVIIQQNSSIPKDITVSAFEIINGSDYIKVKESLGDLEFYMYYVSVTRNGKPFASDENFIYIFPAEGFDVRYCKVFSFQSNSKLNELNSYGEFNVMACETNNTGIFIITQDKRYSPGDLNGDGLVQAKDARTALRVAALLENCDEKQLLAGDINKNGKIDASDARKILRFASKLDII